MPKNRFILVMLSMVCFEISAQKIAFDLSGRLNFTLRDEYTSSEKRELYSYWFLTDSTAIRTQSEYSLNTTNDYKPNPGYEINGLFKFNLSERLALRTGVGLSFGSFSVGSNFKFVEGNVISVDTVPIDTLIIIPGPNPCDCYENSYGDISSDYDPRILHETLNFSMPAELESELISDRLHVRGGLFFQTPLYAATTQEFIGIVRTTVGDTTKCKYVKETEKNIAATGISNFQWGVSAWISYRILPQLQIEIGARKHMNDMYVKEDYQLFTNNNNSFKPLTFSAGVSYRLYIGTAEK